MGLHNRKYGFAQPKVWVCNRLKTGESFILHNRKYGYLSSYTTKLRESCDKKGVLSAKIFCLKGFQQEENKKKNN